MTEKERFSAAVVKMRAVSGGLVKVADWPERDGRDAYRRACVTLDELPRHEVPARVAELAALALDIGGHLSLFTFTAQPEVTIEVSLSRDLYGEEVRDLVIARRSMVVERSCEPVPLEAA